MSSANTPRVSGAPSPPLAALQQMDACCDRFEAEWLAGQTPSLDDFLQEVGPEHRCQLGRELLAIELEYRRGPDGKPMSAHQLFGLHPALDDEIAAELDQLPTLRTPTSAEPDTSQEATARREDSGLHIRCPHCQNPVELLDDTPLEEITCRLCGSNFTLVGEEEAAPGKGDAAPIKRIGRFELLKQIGVGGFGAVWKARDTDLDRCIALKIPRRGQISRNEAELFFREARAAAQLRHPHIVPVHEVGRDGDTIFIVSDLIRGETLSEWMKGKAPNFRDIADLLATVADALDAAHSRGVIHRDLKPSNVMIDEAGEPHLMDFGLAKRQFGEVTMTVDGQILGTPAYMSPEQAAGESHWIDRRTDIYSFGAMLFHLLTGELPFRGSLHSQIRQRLEEDAPNPRRLNHRIPEDLATICLKCLERDPNRRYATSKEVAEELRRYLRGEPIHARPLSRTQRVVRWAKRNPALAAVALLTAVLAIGGPTAAVVIAGKNRALETRLREITEIIRRGEAESDSAAQAIQQLGAERDQLTAGNPAAALLPDDWRATLASDYLQDHYKAAAEQTSALSADSAKRAAAHLALARLLRIASREEEAVDQYQAARRVYDTRVERTAADGDRVALATCLTELSSLLEDLGQHDQADRLAEASLELREAIAQASSGLQSQVDHLYAVDDHVRRQTERLAGEPLTPGGEPAELVRSIGEARQAVDKAWSSQPQSAIEVAEALVE